MRQQHLIIVAWLFSLLTACSNSPDHPQMVGQLPAIYPDYVGVTVPAGIAPLNFNMADARFDRMDVTVRGSRGGELHVNG